MPELTPDERRALLLAYRDGVLDPGQAVLLEVERIVREHMAQAWDEGADALITLTRGGPVPSNPYREEADRG